MRIALLLPFAVTWSRRTGMSPSLTGFAASRLPTRLAGPSAPGVVSASRGPAPDVAGNTGPVPNVHNVVMHFLAAVLVAAGSTAMAQAPLAAFTPLAYGHTVTGRRAYPAPARSEDPTSDPQPRFGN